MENFEGYFEDFNPELEFISPSITITEGNLANYIAFAGEYNQIYVSEEFAKKSIFGGRVVPEMMVFTLATGLCGMIKGLNGPQSLAMFGQSWTFQKVARVGDTITLKVTFPKKRETRRADRGTVTRWIEVLNQEGEVIATGEQEQLIQRRG